MPDSKITALASTGTGTDPANDPLVIVDVSDTSMAATGTTKKVTLNNLLACSPTATLASATITGDLTVDTSTLKVDSTNNRVGIVNASPAYPLDVTGIINSSQDVYALGGRLALYRSAGSSYVDWATSQDLVWRHVTSVGGAGASTLMTLNSTGLGVGVASPSSKFHVDAGASSEYFRGAGNSGAARALVISASTTTNAGDTHTFNAGSVTGVLAFATGGTVRATVDAAGNCGIGVTPSAWNTSFKAIELLGGNINTSSTANIRVVQNAVYTSSQFVYKTAGLAATSYSQSAGAHTFFNAPVGANANDPITFSPAMTLDASGRLILLASTTTPATLATNGELTFTATSNTNLRFSYRGSDGTTRVANITLA